MIVHRKEQRAALLDKIVFLFDISRTKVDMFAESKFLLLKHCFEDLECISVIFKTHKFNKQSRTAIEAIGASLDGILRNDRRMADGSVRDTAQYSIIREEWPAVQKLLNARLEKYL